MYILNVLNGDATRHSFEQAGLAGEVLVWDEVLSEGPVPANAAVEEFFAVRARWLAGAFAAGMEEYQNEVLAKYQTLKNYTAYDEVVLWYEYDLHCQINLIFLLHVFYLNPNTDRTNVFLICPDSHPHHPHFAGIGQLTPAELAVLADQRIQLHEADLAIASAAWMAYCSSDAGEIEKVLALDSGNLLHLKPALSAHLTRFEHPGTGLSGLDKVLIHIAEQVSGRKELYTKFWESNLIYGMGDAEIDLHVDKLIAAGHIRPLV